MSVVMSVLQPLLFFFILAAPVLAADDRAASSSQENVHVSHVNAPYNDFLNRYVVAKDGINLIDYAAVTASDLGRLKAYVKTLEAMRPSDMSRAEQIAYYANIYNAKTLVIILENYPVKSIRQIGGGLIFKGPWRKKVLTIEGQELSLDNIEHDIVRARFDEPRIHYAFNCAAMGCPNLHPTAWEADSLEADLDAAARTFIAHPRGVFIDTRGRVRLSSIYKWFRQDFGDNDAAVLDHIRQYAAGEKAVQLEGVSRIHTYDYDWALNEVK